MSYFLMDESNTYSSMDDFLELYMYVVQSFWKIVRDKYMAAKMNHEIHSALFQFETILFFIKQLTIYDKHIQYM